MKALLVAALACAACSGSSGATQTPAPKKAEEQKPLAISNAALEKNPIATAKVEKAKLAADLRVVGSVSYDQDHYAVVGPLIAGRVTKLRAGLGDSVRAGQVLADIESTEVGQAQATYLATSARAGAAQANLRRERDLAAQRISSERDREVAEAQAISEDAEAKAAIERLRAFGLADSDIAAIKNGGGTAGRVPLRAPIAGTIVMRSITLGQAVERATDAFKIVNLNKLWVLLDLYEKDLTRVHVGQKVELHTEAYLGEVFKARVAYVNPIIDEKTRTANVRVEFDNPGGKMRPGQFVTAKLIGDPTVAPIEALAVSRRAVVTVDGKSLVFQRTPQGFERRLVETGMSGGEYIEIKNGLKEGDEVATDGAFLLKSEMLR
jgi:membrane fusion protein, heavy metal efflux system